jgi:excisionase family DNA binding protein
MIKTRAGAVVTAGRATFSVEEAAEVLGIGRNTCYEQVKIGSIPSIRVGKRILIPRAALDRMLAGEAA